ncbi:MAG: hypothetical protein WCK89_13410, partial [bacterium]
MANYGEDDTTYEGKTSSKYALSTRPVLLLTITSPWKATVDKLPLCVIINERGKPSEGVIAVTLPHRVAGCGDFLLLTILAE